MPINPLHVRVRPILEDVTQRLLDEMQRLGRLMNTEGRLMGSAEQETTTALIDGLRALLVRMDVISFASLIPTVQENTIEQELMDLYDFTVLGSELLPNEPLYLVDDVDVGSRYVDMDETYLVGIERWGIIVSPYSGKLITLPFDQIIDDDLTRVWDSAVNEGLMTRAEKEVECPNLFKDE